MKQADIRRQIRHQREQLSINQIDDLSQKITKRALDYIANNLRIGFYMPNRGEVDPNQLMQYAWQNHCTCFLPSLHPNEKNQLVFLQYTLETVLTRNRHGILEVTYQSHWVCKPTELDVVFVPLVAFDHKNHRIGMGAGYYDKTFHFKLNHPNSPPQLIGLAYQFQQVDRIDAQPWDVTLDAIVTENSIVI